MFTPSQSELKDMFYIRTSPYYLNIAVLTDICGDCGENYRLRNKGPGDSDYDPGDTERWDELH